MKKNGKTHQSMKVLSELEDFDEIIIRYIGTDNSLMDIWNSACPDDSLSEIWINATLSPSQEFAIKQDEGKEKQTTEQIVPPEYHEYLDVFQEEVERFPDPRPWDHAIDMKPGFEPRSHKSYNLTPEEREQQELFITENLKKGYIRPSKSPMASPFLLCLKERWTITTDTRLSILQPMDHQERTSPSFDL
jgi:hypothetical protein